MSATEVAAWIAVITSTFALVAQGVNLISKRKKERIEIEQALDQQPAVRQQLELGNVGEAVKHLNVIIQSQAAHIAAQDKRIDELESENAQLRKEMDEMRREIGRRRL